MIASILANANRDRKHRSKPFKIEDFMPKPTPTSKRRQTPEQQAAILRFAAAGGAEGLLRVRK